MAWSVQGNIKGPIGNDATVAVGTVTTGAAGSAAAVNNVGTPGAATFDFVIPKGDKGADGADGAGIAIQGNVATYSALPTGLTAGDAGKAYFVDADGKLYIWSGTAFPADGAGTVFRGPAGINGADATVALGTVTTGAAGSSAAISNSGTAGAATFNFTIPRGDAGTPGTNGAAATVAVGTVATGASGSSVTVVNSGTSSAATLDFSIPRGADGTNGTNGAKWYFGDGAPATVAGSVPGDLYLDTNAATGGTVYQLS